MPKLSQNIKIQISDLEGVYQEAKNSLTEIGAIEIKESVAANSKELEGVVPSIWGWGGMNVGAKLSQNNDFIELIITGYIAQLATGPLKKNMTVFAQNLSKRLESKYNYKLDLSKTKASGMQITEGDKKLFVIILVGVFIVTFLGAIFGNAFELMLWSSVIGLGYYWGRKYLYKK